MRPHRIVPPDYLIQMAETNRTEKRLFVFGLLIILTILSSVFYPRPYKTEVSIIRYLKVCMPESSKPGKDPICGAMLPPLSANVLACGRFIPINKSMSPSYILKKEGWEYPVAHESFPEMHEAGDFCLSVPLDSWDRKGKYTFSIYDSREKIAEIEFQILQ